MAQQLVRVLAVIAVIAVMCIAPPGLAGHDGQDIYPGHDAPGFVAALDRWLYSDEAEALAELAALAQDGVVAAQVLLALIDKTAALQGPWLAHSSRAERTALLRAPGPFSGRSWMHAAAQSSPAAERWVRLWDVRARPALAMEFLATGERRGAREALIAAAARQYDGFEALAAQAGYPLEMSYLVWQEVPGWGIGDLHPGDPQLELTGTAPDPALRAEWLMEADVALMPRSLCEYQCGDTVVECTRAAYDALNSYPALTVLGAPSEQLIPTEVFARSPRGRAAFLRRILLQTDARSRRAVIADAHTADACFGALLHSEAERYRPLAQRPEPNGQQD